MSSILVTGGTGTFGRAFIRELLHADTYSRICIYSRGEHAQADMRAALDSEMVRAPTRLRFFIGDVRDRWRLTRALEGIDHIVHAAALKRIEVGYYNPVEMVRTNVEGAINVVESARDSGVAKVVFLSTDKAVQPISPYGLSKALAERIFLAADAHHKGTAFTVTRYGNVWNSAGSVYPTWRRILASGATEVPVTDPACTRFFMHVREATQLVHSTLLTMRGGELVIPTLPAYRLGDLAAAMGARCGPPLGLPPWEKRHEYMAEENCSYTARRMTIQELKDVIATT